ncbi:MAG: hypothetical protein AB8F95_09715 [Bacteroidia bacterium]
MRPPHAQPDSPTSASDSPVPSGGNRRKRMWRRGSIALVILALLVGGYCFVSYWLGPILAERLSDQIHEKTDGVYSVEVDAARINLLTNSLLIRDVRVRADSSKTNDFRVEADIPLVQITLPFDQIWKKQPLSLEHVRLFQPNVWAGGRFNKTKSESNIADLFSQQIDVDELAIEGGTFTLRGRKEALAIRDLSLVLDGLHIADSSWRYERLEVGASLEDLNWPLPDSLHQVTLGSLTFSSTDESLIAQNLNLKPLRYDSTTLQASVAVPRLSFDGLQLQDFFQTKKLHLERIEIGTPDIRLVGQAEEKPFSRELSRDFLDALYPKIEPFVKSLKAEEIAIQDARFVQYSHSNQRLRQVEGLDIALKDFALNATSNQKILHSEDIRLEADAYYLMIGDDYELSGKSVWLSTLSRFFQTDSIKLRPQHPRAAYDIEVPSLMIEGLDANEAWFDRKIAVQKIHIAEPAVAVRRAPGIEAANIADLADRDLYSLISGKLNSLEIKDLELEGGTVSVKLEEGNKAPFTAKDVGLWIRDFKLAPNQNKEDARPFNAEDVKLALNADTYSFTLPDSSHQVQLQGIQVSTADSAIIVDSLMLHPLATSTAADNLSLVAPSIVLYGLNALSLIRDGQLEVDRVHIAKPTAHFTQKQNTKAKAISPQNVHAWATRRLRAIGLRTFEIEDAEFSYTRGIDTFHIPSLDFGLENVLVSSILPPEGNDWRFADAVSFTLRQIDEITPDGRFHAKADSVYFNSNEGLIQAIGTHIHEQDSQGMRAYIDVLEAGGFNIFELIEKRKLDLDVIRLIAPQLTFQQNDDTTQVKWETLSEQLALPPWIDMARVQGIQVEHGGITLQKQGQSIEEALSVQQIEVQVLGVTLTADQAKPRLLSDDISLAFQIDDAQFVSADSSVKVRLGHIGVQQSGRVVLLDSIFVQPYDEDKASAFEAFVPRLVLEGVDIQEIVKKRKAALDAIRIVEPSIRLGGDGTTEIKRSDIQAYVQGKGLFPLINIWLDTLQCKQLSVEQASLAASPAKGMRWNAQAVNLNLHDLLVDRYSRVNRYFYAKNFDAQTGGISLILPDSLYNIRLAKSNFNSEKGRIDLEGIFLEPRLGLYEFAQSKGYALDRANLHIPRLRVIDFDTEALLTRQAVHLGQIQILSPSLELFRNAQLPDSFPPKQASMQELLRNVPFPLTVDSTYINNARIRYQLHEDGSDRPGILSFDDISLTSNTFSNDSIFLPNHPETRFDGRCRVMDSVDLELRFRFDNESETDEYTITGLMATAPDLRVFNPMLEPAGFVSIRDGSAEKLAFSIDANMYGASGRMKFYYEDLRVKVLSKKKETFKGFESFMANSFVLRKYNPGSRFLRVGRICYRRDLRRSVFRFWAKSFLSGIQSSLGLRAKEDRIKNLFRLKK